MVNVALHRLAILLTVSTLFLVIAGASVTTSFGGFGVPVQFIAVSYDCMAQVLFAGTAVLAFLTSPAVRRSPLVAEEGGWPTLRTLAPTISMLTLLQVILGAAFRHRVIGILPHVIGAAFVAIALVTVATFVLVQFPRHSMLCRIAWAQIGVTLAQIGLGVLAYAARLNHLDSTYSGNGVVVSAVAHGTFGAFTLACSLALAAGILSLVQPRTAIQSGLSAVSQ